MVKRKEELIPNRTITSFFKKQGPKCVATDESAPKDTLPVHKRARTSCSQPALSSRTVSATALWVVATAEVFQDGHPDTGALEVETLTVSETVEAPTLALPVALGRDLRRSPTFQPFRRLPYYLCPFSVVGLPCSHPNTSFDTFKSMNQHVRLKHAADGLVTMHAEDPMQDGTLKIPYHKACGPLFSTYQQANHHAKSKSCTGTERSELICAYKPFVGCEKIVHEAKGLANHHRSHVKDSRAPFQCAKGCGEYYADLYILAMHEERCDSQGFIVRDTSLRFVLAGPDHPPSMIVLARSSGEKPQIWKAGLADFNTGLPIWGAKIVEHYSALFGTVPGTTLLHASYECHTRDLPAPAHNDGFRASGNRQKEIHRAFRVTQEIQDSIKAANAAGINPVVLSVGLDGWACDARMIEPWLRETQLKFTLIIRLNELAYGMGKDHVILYRGVYWASYKPQDILRALEQGEGTDAQVDELLAAWKRLQDGKNLAFGVKRGRNFVDLSASFTSV